MAYEFNGTNQYLQMGSAVLTAAPLTMACWFNSDSLTVSQVLVSITNQGTAGGITRFAILAAGAVSGDPVRAIASDISANNGIAETTSGYSANFWHHAAGVFTSASSRSVYLDGGNSATDTTSITPTLLDRTNIGVQFLQSAGGTSGIAFADGLIAEVGIWNAALTAAEIASLAKGMTCDKVRPNALVFYAPLIRSLQDLSRAAAITNNNTATVANHPRVYA
jgi:hypothetical protein